MDTSTNAALLALQENNQICFDGSPTLADNKETININSDIAALVKFTEEPFSEGVLQQLTERIQQLTKLTRRDESTIQIPFYSLIPYKDNNQSSSTSTASIQNLEDLKFNQELEKIYQTYPDPKRILHNYYEVLSILMNRKDLNIEPQYTNVDYSGIVLWKCEYSVRWPNEQIFTNFGYSKKDTATNAALLILKWLKEANKISFDGLPIVEYEPTITGNERNKNISSEIAVLDELIREPLSEEVLQQIIKRIEQLTNVLQRDEKMIQILVYSATLYKENDDKAIFGNQSYGTVVAGGIQKDDALDKDLQFNQELEKLHQLYPDPKLKLQNYYETLSIQMNRFDFIIRPEYEKVDHCGKVLWKCSYSVKWPDEHRFTNSGGVSKEATSTNAALLALQWLKQNNKLEYKPIATDNKTNENISSEVEELSKICSTSKNVLHLFNKMLSTKMGQNFETASEYRKIGKKHRWPNNEIFSDLECTKQEILEKTFLTPFKDIKINSSFNVTNEKLMRSTINCENNLKAATAELIESMQLFPTNLTTSIFDQSSIPNESEESKSLTQSNDLELSSEIAVLGKIYTAPNDKLPDKMKFIHLGLTKQDKITYNETQVKKITRRIETFKLDAYQKTKLNDIVQLHEEYLLPSIMQIGDINESLSKDLVNEDETITRCVSQKFGGLDVYAAKESVVLPIAKYKEEFISYLTNNRVVIVKGEPGCGKSTRIPQYILEGWSREAGLNGEPCRIVVTQPTCIAAISLAERVAKERKENLGNIVGYQIKFNLNFNRYTGRILYCTTGIFLRQLRSNPKFSNFTHIVLDEAHERDVNTDLLMNLVRSALEHNPNIKVIVMSVTDTTKLFQNYFDGAPFMHIPGFTYPVKVHYLEEAKKLNLARTIEMSKSEHPFVVHEDIVKVINFIHTSRAEGAILCFLPGWDDIMKVFKLIPKSPDLKVLCLHSCLGNSDQHVIFLNPPADVRKVILATNVVENSVTIDDVVYVIDTGIQKEKRLDVEKGVMSIDYHWISQLSVALRKGRIGRVRAGEIFHLYPKWKYDQFLPHSIPEILTSLLTNIVLDAKIYSNNMNAVEFLCKLPCPPNENAVLQAVDELRDLELLDENENLTPLGRTLAKFQLPPKISKTMVNSVIYKCVTPIIGIATIFSADIALFATELCDTQFVRKVKNRYSSSSDHLALLKLFEKWLDYTEVGENYNAERLCREAQLVDYKLKMIKKSREVYFGYLKQHLTDVLPIVDDYSGNDELVCGVLLSGVGTVLEHRNWNELKGRLDSSNIFVTRHNQKATITSESVNHKRTTFPSNFLLYINKTMSNVRYTTIIRDTSLISPMTALLFRNKKLTISELPQENYSEQLKSQDQVLLTIDKTKMEFICDREEAVVLVKCKDALLTGMQYYIHQLTIGGKNNPEVDEHWERILEILNQILTKEDFRLF